MKLFRQLAKWQRVSFYVALMVAGLIFGALGVIFLAQPEQPSESVMGTISDIQEYYDSYNDTTEHRVWVTYTDKDDVLHEDILYPSYNSWMNEGNEVEVVYLLSDHEELIAPDQGVVLFILAGIGAALFVIGLALTVKYIRRPAEADNEFDRVSPATFTQEDVEAVKNNDEPETEYYFHFTGKLGQSYVLETTSRQPIVEANCDKITLFRPYVYTFLNHRTGRSKTEEVSHTVTTSYGTSAGAMNVKSVMSSRFKIGGQNCWDRLGALGYSVEPYLDGLKINFHILRYGVPTARLQAAGANVARANYNSKFGDVLPAKGVYRVFCKESDLDGVFLAAFILARVEY